jgi:hypothetical protein
MSSKHSKSKESKDSVPTGKLSKKNSKAQIAKTLDKAGNRLSPHMQTKPQQMNPKGPNAIKNAKSHAKTRKHENAPKARKETSNEVAAKSGKKRKHDMFFAPPEPTEERALDKKESAEPAEPVELELTESAEPESQAVIETIKMPVEAPEPGNHSLPASVNRSGVVSVVDKAHKRRKKSDIDIVAELEKDAQKVIRTGSSLGTGLEVDGWD